MPDNDFSNYFNSGKNKVTPRLMGEAQAGRRTLIYLVIIFSCVCALVLLLIRGNVFKLPLSVEETLPPGVPFEAPPLDQLPGGK